MRAILVAGSIARHSMGMLAQALLVAAIIGALTLGAATLANVAPSGAESVLAGKGSGGAGSSVWIMELSETGRVAPLRYGNAFTVGYSTKDRQPWAFTQCVANSTTVLSASPYADGSIWGEYFSVYSGGPLPQAFVVGESVSPIWTGGGADCTVSLLRFSADYARQTVLAVTTFSVAP